MQSTSLYSALPTTLLVGTGAVVFLANAGLLVLQLVAGRYLAPFIGSSVETWTSVIGVFLTGIALGNWLGGRLADRFPSPRTVSILLVLSGIASLGMIGCYEFALNTGFYKSIPLGPRIPVLAILFCLLPAFLMSLLTPLTIKLLLPDVGSAGRIAGLIFCLSTLGCLIGNYLTGFWLLAKFDLNTITSFVGFGLIALALPVFFFRVRPSPTPASPPAKPNAPSKPLVKATPAKNPDADVDGWSLRDNRRIAFALVFVSSFCGMSLELVGIRVLAPILGVSLYTWTGVIGVMLAGTASGNWLGGVLADRGVRPALQRFSVLVGALVGIVVAPAFFRGFKLDGFAVAGAIFPDSIPTPNGSNWFDFGERLVGAAVAVALVIIGLRCAKTRKGGYLVLAVIGGLIGTAFAYPTCRAIARATELPYLLQLPYSPSGPYIIHAAGFALGAIIALMFIWDAPKKDETIPRSTALSGSFFLAGLLTLAVLLLFGIFSFYDYHEYPLVPGFMHCEGDTVLKVLAWTFGLFFLPMLMLGTISPQVIRLSVSDTQSAGRVAGSIYAWSTIGAIVGTFATGYFLIGTVGTFRVMMMVALILSLLAFFVGKLWKNNAMLYAASVICGGAIFGFIFSGYTPFQNAVETKYYAILVGKYSKKQVKNDEPEPEPEFRSLTLDHLLHSVANIEDPEWLFYKHEYVQGELLLLARQRSHDTSLLVIGGGGYTFPKYVESQMPDVNVDVVEIDPGVTKVAYEEFGLSRDTKIRTFNMDGRQFISEQAKKRHYQMVVQDAVNDYSVPYHLLTREYNDAVKSILADDGAYLLTLIDPLKDGRLWRAAFHTMKESFKHVYMLAPDSFYDWEIEMVDGNEKYVAGLRKERGVYVILGSDTPLDQEALFEAVEKYRLQKVSILAPLAPVLPPLTHTPLAAAAWAKGRYLHVLDDKTVNELLAEHPKIVLTDQFCPVDNLMADVFRYQKRR